MRNILQKFTAKLTSILMLAMMAMPTPIAFANTGTLEVEVSPAAGSYYVVNDVTGQQVIPAAGGSVQGTQSFGGLQAGDYAVIFNDLNGYITPKNPNRPNGAFPFTISQGAYVTITGNYEIDNVQNTGVLNVSVSPAEGTYEVLNDVTGEVVIAETSGTKSFGGITFGDYVVHFKDVTGYDTPTNENRPDGGFPFTLDENNLSASVDGFYELEGESNTGLLQVTVSPEEATYTVVNDVTGEEVVGASSGSQSFGGITYGDYRVEFADLTGYTTPGNVSFTLDSAHPFAAVYGYYELETQVNTGSITVNVSPEEGIYEIRDFTTGDLVVAETTGSQSFSGITFGDYIVEFKDINGYVTPNAVTVNVDSNTPDEFVDGFYTLIPRTGSIQVNIQNQDGDPITLPVDKPWSINGSFAQGTATSTLGNVPSNVDYTIDFPSAGEVDGYSGVVLSQANPQTLNASETITFTVTYFEEQSNNIATINITTVSDQGPTVAGQVSLNGIDYGNAPVTLLVDITEANTITFGNNVVDHTPPAPLSFSVGQLVGGQTYNYEGVYTSVDYSAEIQITTINAAGEIFVDGVSIGTPTTPGTYITYTVPDVRQDVVLSYGAVVGFNTPANETITGGTLIAGSTNNLYEGVYTTNFATINVTTLGATGEIFVNGVSIGTPATAGDYLSTNVDITVDNVISYGFVAGFTTPANETIPMNTLVGSSTNNNYEGTYISAGSSATINVTTLDATGEIFVNGVSIGTPATPGTYISTTVDVSVNNVISYGAVAGFFTPVDETILAGTLIAGSTNNDYEGDYDPSTATLDITTQPVAGEIFLNGVSLGTPAAPGTIISTTIDVTVDNTVSYGAVAGYTTATDDFFGANTLAASSTTAVQGDYTIINTMATIEVTTLGATGEVFVDGVSIGTPATPGDYLSTMVDVTVAHVISYGAVAGFITPGDDNIPANFLTPGTTTQFDRTYVPVSTSATFEITTQPVAGEIFLNGVSLGTPAAPGTIISTTIDVTVDNTVSYGTVAGYTTATDDFFGANTVLAGATVNIQGDYTVDPTATIEVTTQPVAGEVFLNGVSIGTPASAGAFVTSNIDTSVINTISYGAVGGYQAPVDEIIPAGSLTPGSNTQYTGNYTQDFTLTKVADQATVGDNTVVTYTITLTRQNTDPGTINVDLTDTVTSTGTINGSNGGAMNVIMNMGNCSGVTCSGNQIDQGPITVAMDTAGSQAVITYQVRSDNSSIPAGQNSAAINTATATYGAGQMLQASTSVTITGPSAGSGGGSSSGVSLKTGGHELVKGDMSLNIKHFVSNDGINYVATTEKGALAVAKNATSTVYHKIVMENTGKVSATNIKLAPSFDAGDSGLNGGDISNIRGAKLNSKHGYFVVNKVMVGETKEVTYQRSVSAQDATSQIAIDGITLVDFGSRLPDYSDGLRYLGKGEITPAYLNSGNVAAKKPRIPGKQFAFVQGAVLSIAIEASKASAHIGEMVDFVITVTNTSEEDITNLNLYHDYSESLLAIAKSVGAKDNGQELIFKRAILRPGQAQKFYFTASVIGGEAGQIAKGMTRVLVNQTDDVPVAYSALEMLGGAVKSTQPQPFILAETGASAAASAFIFSLITTLGIRAVNRRREEVVLGLAPQTA